MKTDELGHPDYIEALKLKGKTLDVYGMLSVAQKGSVRLIRNIPPINSKDKRFECSTAVNISFHYPPAQIVKAIMAYKQRLDRGPKPKKMVEAMMELLNSNAKPIPDHVHKNKMYYDKWVKKMHRHHVIITEREIVFKTIEEVVPFDMEDYANFKNQLSDKYKKSIEWRS